jgi:DNA-binding SARP family transcriptional activator
MSKLHELLQKSYDAFVEETKKSRLILLHHESRLRSMLVAKLMNSSDFDTFYYAIGPDDVNLKSFINGITNGLVYQHVTFGRHVNVLPPAALENPIAYFDLVLEALVADISELSSSNFLLILDEYDMSDRADEVQRFVERLSSRFPAHGRLVLNGRTLPRLPWLAMFAQDRVSILRDDALITNNLYGNPNEDREKDSVIQVYTVGPGLVIVDGVYIDTWEGHLPRLLFFFGLDRPFVTRSEICDAFWPELDVEQAVNVFHVTKRRLHKALDADVLIHEDGYYQINPELPIYYDALEFVDALIASRLTDDIEVKMEKWGRVAELYRGTYLKGHDDTWILERRDEFRDGYIEALMGLSSVWRVRGRQELALSLLQKASRLDLYREDVHRELMSLFVELSRRGEAAAHYKQIGALLKAEKRAFSPDLEAFYHGLIS